MAKRELSSTLKNLKFMQRTKSKEEDKVSEVPEEAKVVVLKSDGGGFTSSVAIKRKCIVVMEGDPHPGAVKGRMSFQSFNPTIDKLNQEAAECSYPQTSTSNTQDIQCETYGREHRLPTFASDIDLKRKQPEMEIDSSSHDNSEQILLEANQKSSSANNKGVSKRQQKREKLDWNVLRRAKVEDRSG